MTGYDLAKRWYSASIPKKLDNYFASFAAKSASLAFQIAPGYLRIDPKAETAYIDHNSIAYLPQKYFDERFYEELGIEPENVTAAAITVINGSTIHEALHRRWTSPFLILTKTLDHYISTSKGKRNPDIDARRRWLTERYTKDQIEDSAQKWLHAISKESYDSPYGMDRELLEGSDISKTIAVRDSLTIFCIQLIEDLYNENRCRGEFEGISGFLNAKNTILFNKKFEELKEEVKVKLDRDNLMNMLVTYKSIDVRVDDIWNNEFIIPIVEMMNEAENPLLDTFGRTDLAIRLSMFIQQNDQIEESESESDVIMKFIDGQSESESGPSSEAAGMGSEEAEEIANEFSRLMKNAELKMMKLDDDSTILPDHKFDLQSIKKPTLIDIEDAVTLVRTPVKYNSNFLKFANSMRFAMETKFVYGSPKERGPEISKKFLNRIGFDSRIFTRRDTIGREIGIPDVNMLCDISGSMAYKTVHNENRIQETLCISAVRAAYGAHISMCRLGIPNAVYAHSTGGARNGDGCTVYGIAAFQMPFMSKSNDRITTTRHNEVRFTKATHASNNENYDGFAIREVSKHFSSRENDKILIVLSDGQPSATNYGGQEAIEHTHTIVNILRRDGMKVFSMSLIPQVVEINDYIYGQEFNMRAFGTNLNKNMEEIVRRAILM